MAEEEIAGIDKLIMEEQLDIFLREGGIENFYLMQPYGLSKDQIISVIYFDDFKRLFLPHFRKVFADSANKPDSFCTRRNSQLMNSKTLSDFFYDIDRAVEASGIDKSKLAEFVKNIEEREEETPLDWKPDAEFYELLRPVYVLLREQGYNRKDLCIGY